ncbi:unnamed protein product [Meloidogyne enterolobii]|uniref:Uncharacterized protein n=1 Tax=Meloidogyne enterolobii TaxID=390850 RepID=A0ACB0ZE19_MELEN
MKMKLKRKKLSEMLRLFYKDHDLNARLNYELNMEYLTDIVEKIQNKKESMKKLM